MKKAKSVCDSIMMRKLTRLRWLESCLKEVIKCADSTLKKIEAEGISGNYSCNHDVQKWSERVHRTSYEMWLLSDIQSFIENNNDVIEVIVEDDRESETKNESNETS